MKVSRSLLRKIILEQLLKEEIYNNNAICYHASDSPPEDFTEYIKDYRPGGGAGAVYGLGLYVIFEENLTADTFSGHYGHYVYKIKTNLNGCISFVKSVCEKLYGRNLSPYEQLVETGKKQLAKKIVKHFDNEKNKAVMNNDSGYERKYKSLRRKFVSKLPDNETQTYINPDTKYSEGESNDSYAIPFKDYLFGHVPGIIYYGSKFGGIVGALYDTDRAIPLGFVESGNNVPVDKQTQKIEWNDLFIEDLVNDEGEIEEKVRPVFDPESKNFKYKTPQDKFNKSDEFEYSHQNFVDFLESKNTITLASQNLNSFNKIFDKFSNFVNTTIIAERMKEKTIYICDAFSNFIEEIQIRASSPEVESKVLDIASNPSKYFTSSLYLERYGYVYTQILQNFLYQDENKYVTRKMVKTPDQVKVMTSAILSSLSKYNFTDAFELIQKFKISNEIVPTDNNPDVTEEITPEWEMFLENFVISIYKFFVVERKFEEAAIESAITVLKNLWSFCFTSPSIANYQIKSPEVKDFFKSNESFLMTINNIDKYVEKYLIPSIEIIKITQGQFGDTSALNTKHIFDVADYVYNSNLNPQPANINDLKKKINYNVINMLYAAVRIAKNKQFSDWGGQERFIAIVDYLLKVFSWLEKSPHPEQIKVITSLENELKNAGLSTSNKTPEANNSSSDNNCYGNQWGVGGSGFLLICAEDKTLFLHKRSESVTGGGGKWSYPGGGIMPPGQREGHFSLPINPEYILDDNDPKFLKTALIEFKEETGLDYFPQGTKKVGEYLANNCGHKYKTFIFNCSKIEKDKWTNDLLTKAKETDMTREAAENKWFTAKEFSTESNLAEWFTPELKSKIMGSFALAENTAWARLNGTKMILGESRASLYRQRYHGRY